jgi:hypothetical protein
MDEKNYAAWNPTPNPKRWSHPQFCELHRYDARKGYEFRWETNGDPVPAELLTAAEKASQAVVPDAVAETGLSPDELRLKLEEKGVTPHPRLGLEKLIALAKEHNVI